MNDRFWLFTVKTISLFRILTVFNSKKFIKMRNLKHYPVLIIISHKIQIM